MITEVEGLDPFTGKPTFTRHYVEGGPEPLHDANASCRCCCPENTPHRAAMSACGACRRLYEATFPNEAISKRTRVRNSPARWDALRAGILRERAHRDGVGRMIFRLRLEAAGKDPLQYGFVR